ncbi:hypothetical protein LTR16_000004 [Cryomyces antarcticus]|uniref:Uncharacterized protein n=1 Tax=Cryomyces antarcticus TaxID=329879 RepID=A0ABR0KUX9_9PEZI|nr:hypothetical protein LTR16_000004 [Cryomyces antarcticus]
MFVQATPDISTQVMETQQIAANRKRSAPSSATRSSTKKAKQFKAAVRDVKKKQTDDEGESVPISIGNLPLLRPSPAKEIGQSEPAAAATIAEPSLEDGEEMSLVKPVESQEPDQTTARGLLEYYCRSNGLPTPHFEGIRKAESQGLASSFPCPKWVGYGTAIIGEKEYCSLAAHTEEIAAQEDAAKVATRLMGLYVDVYDRTFPEKTSPEATRTMLRDALQWWEQSVPILEPQLGPWLASVPPEKWPYPDVDLQAHSQVQAAATKQSNTWHVGLASPSEHDSHNSVKTEPSSRARHLQLGRCAAAIPIRSWKACPWQQYRQCRRTREFGEHCFQRRCLDEEAATEVDGAGEANGESSPSLMSEEAEEGEEEEEEEEETEEVEDTEETEEEEEEEKVENEEEEEEVEKVEKAEKEEEEEEEEEEKQGEEGETE